MADQTPAGSTRFEQARVRLARRLDVEVETVTDDQVRLFLATGQVTPPAS